MVPVMWSNGPCICAYCPNRHKSRSFMAMYKHLREKHSTQVEKFAKRRYMRTYGKVSVAYTAGERRHFLFDEGQVPRQYSDNVKVEKCPTDDPRSSGGFAVAQGSVKRENEEKENVDKDGDSALSGTTEQREIPEVGKKRPREIRDNAPKKRTLPLNKLPGSGLI